MNLIGRNAKKASLEKIDTKTKNKILKKYVFLINKNKNSIIVENTKDVKFALKKGLKKNLIDRLVINHKKLDDIKTSINKKPSTGLGFLNRCQAVLSWLTSHPTEQP